jgi:glycosyltransferase involved in cell wall biosynthesis
MKPVSVIFLVKDPPLERLAALVEYMRAVADEFIVVIDDRTADATVTIIRDWPGVKHVMFRWCDDFAAARNAALPLVTRPWTLHLDPDELPSFEMMQHIKQVTERNAERPIAFTYWTPNWWGGKKGEEMPYHWHIRLWQTGHGEFYRAVHELVRLDGMEESMTRGTLAVEAPREARLIHSKGWEDAVAAQDYYETLGERSL